MNFNQYQELAERTARATTDTRERLTNFSLGLVGETGEVVDCIKKILYHGHDLEMNRDKLMIELGDLLWYTATLANTAGITMQEIAEANIAKLRKRYPEGFDPERSRNREG